MINIEIKPSQKVNGELSAFISFPYDNELVGILRNQTSRFWHAEQKIWEVPATKLSVVVSQFGQRPIRITGYFEPAKPAVVVEMPDGFSFKTKPFQHQIEGFIHGLKFDRFLLGDEQGLGKTKQVIDIAVAKKLTKGYKHCLIIAGVNGLKWNWEHEIKTHSHEQSLIIGTRLRKNGKPIVGSNADKLADLQNLPEDIYFLITNVESLRDKAIQEKISELCKSGAIEMVAIDEIHKCKNPSSQQGKAILKVLPETRIALTGTPLMNQPLDLYVIMKWLGFEKHGFFQFKKHYCVMGGYGGYEVVGYRNLAELKENLDAIMLRRLKKETLDLPEKLYSIEYVEMTKEQAKIYDEVRTALKSEIDKIKLSPNPLVQLIRLRQATGYTGILSTSVKESAKLDRLEEIVEELVANNQKCIIFSNWTEMTHAVEERLAQYHPAVITGETRNRQEEQARFTTDSNCKCIIGTIGAMGTGLTLTAGSTVIFLDSPWNRANKEQAEDRAHRIGTTSTVNIITIVCKNTIDERIEDLIYSKGAMADLLVDGKVNGTKQADIVDYLLA